MKDELVGYKDLGGEVIKCGDCGEKLIDIVLIENNDSRQDRGQNSVKSMYKLVDCPECGGSSFWTKIFDGRTILGPIKKGFTIEDSDSDFNDDGVFCSTIRLVK